MIKITPFLRLVAPCALMLLPGVATAQSGVAYDDWKNVTIPPPPPLEAVTVDTKTTALLILDMSAGNCVIEKRPSCVRSLPHVRSLLDQARAKHMMVVYATGATTPEGRKVVHPLEPLPGETIVQAVADKFYNSDMEKVLRDKNIKTVIVTGTSAEGAVLYSASSATLRGFKAIVPVDTYSAVHPFSEIYTAFHLKNAPIVITSNTTLTRSEMISFK